MSVSATPRFYALVWRWHFYAGLLVIPVMLMLAITGSIYLFKPQLDALMYPHLMQVRPAQHRVSADAMQAGIAAQYPAMTLKKYLPPPATDRSAQFQIALADGASRTVFVDPYRNVILGVQDPDWTLQGAAVLLHGELMMGTWGDLLVELSASWAVLLVISGLYMWWPRKQGRWGVFLPRLRAGKRVFWRDLHVVGGFWSSVLLLFLLLTGLPWTGFWGEKFANVWGQYPVHLWDQPPASTQSARVLNTTLDKTVPWALEPVPLPESDAHAHHQAASAGVVNPRFTLAQVETLAVKLGLLAAYTITAPKGDTGVYTLAALVDDPALQRTYHVDQYSGRVLAKIAYADYGLIPKTVEYGISIHEGKLFGLANQLLMLSVCLMLMMTCITGIVMWWKRRPTGELGAPKTPLSILRWKKGLAVLVGMALFLPTVLASIIVLMLLDWAVLKRWSKVAAS
ncbi:PepSY-associated TM helix domain-containing protein [Chitinibacter sp. S2-10]|uniref:PepSY-associated TM helix domain-containing protein n=1 Tax=Chitinibacter sp. S2-10 TaxID=3373597 RepID=UPI0039776816